MGVRIHFYIVYVVLNWNQHIWELWERDVLSDHVGPSRGLVSPEGDVVLSGMSVTAEECTVNNEVRPAYCDHMGQNDNNYRGVLFMEVKIAWNAKYTGAAGACSSDLIIKQLRNGLRIYKYLCVHIYSGTCL